jgi:predicted RNA polymerase sigma factor
VLGILVRRGNDFAAAEDAVQEALLEAHRTWGGAPADDPKSWLLTVAGRKLIDARRSEAARPRRSPSRCAPSAD